MEKYTVIFLNIMLHQSSLQGGLVVLLVVMRLRGKWAVCTMIQKPIDQADDEHLHDHHLLTQHCRTEARQTESVGSFQSLKKTTSEMHLTGCSSLGGERRSAGDASI